MQLNLGRVIPHSFAVVILCCALHAEAADDPQAFVAKVIDHYRGMKSYQDRVTFTTEYIGKDSDGDDESQTNESMASLCFSSPNRVAYKSRQNELYCDGKTLTIFSPDLDQFIQTPAPAKLNLADLPGNSTLGSRNTNPVLAVVGKPGEAFDRLFPNVQSLTSVRAETRDGVKGHLLEGVLSAPFDSDDQTAPFRAWFDDQLLLREIEIDLKNASQEFKSRRAAQEADSDDGKPASPPVVDRYLIHVKFGDIVTNADMPADRFEFKPEPAAKRVEGFDWSSRGSAADLVGQVAPVFFGTGLGGKAISLAELKGRVVVLDFWATWCHPCVEAIPHVQKLADQFKGKSVTVLGVNRDTGPGPIAAKKVQRFLNKKQITLEQFLDTEGGIAKAYHVSGIPTLVLIDQKGIIRDARVGFDEGVEASFAESIDNLLQGKPLAASADAKQSAEGEGKDDEGDEDEDESATANGKNGASSLANLNSGAIAPTKGTRVYCNGYNVRSFDIDGDGRPEFISTGFQGDIIVVDPDGKQSNSIHLSKTPAGASMSFAQPFRNGKETWWAVIFSHYRTGMDERSEAAVYDSTGKRLWAFKPELPKKRSGSLKLAAGDLNGDGKPEIVIALTHYKRVPMGDRSFSLVDQKANLIILDSAGTQLARRLVGTRVDTLAIAAPTDRTKPAAILCFGDQGLQRFTFDLEAASSQAR